MGAEQARSWLIEFASDGIDPAREAQFRAYLATDPALAAEWAEIEAVDALLARVPPIEPDETAMAALHADITAALDQATSRKPWFAGWLNLTAAGAAACLLLGLLAVNLRPPRQEPETSDRVAMTAPEPDEPAAETAPTVAAEPDPEAELGVAPTEPIASPARVTAPEPDPRPTVAAPTPRRRPAETRVARAARSAEPRAPVVSSRPVARPETDEVRLAMREPATTTGGAMGGGTMPAVTRPLPPSMADAARPPEFGSAEAVRAEPVVIVTTDAATVMAEARHVIRSSGTVLFAMRPIEDSAPARAMSAGETDPADDGPMLAVESAVIESELLPGGGVVGRETR